MTNRRDVELLISARETTGKTFSQVTNNINSLNRKIDEQVAAAERGEGSLQDLKRSQDALAAAGRDLSALQGQIDAYRKLEAQLAKNSAASTAAQAKYAEMKAELNGLEVVTAAQERKLASLEKRERTTGIALKGTTADLEAQGAALKRAGVNTAELDSVQAQIINSAKQAGTGFVSLSTSLSSYSDNVRRTKEAEQQLSAQNVFDDKLAQARQLGEASRFVQLYSQAIGTVKQADNQLAALDGFRAVGQQAVEASNDVSRFTAAGQKMSVASSDIAQGLRQIVDPGREALRTLDGVEASIETASAAAFAEKGNVAGYSNALNQLSAAAAALVSQGSLVDSFVLQEAAVSSARTEMNAAQADVQRLGAAMQVADAPVEELSRSLTIAEAKLEQTGRAVLQEETKLGQLSRQLRTSGIDSNNLVAAQDRLAASATRVAAATAQANGILGRNGQKAKGFLGLDPYALQGVGYQVNDIFVSLQAGQKPLTVFVQQGAQISQYFPGIISSIAKLTLRFFPLIAAAGLATTVFIAMRKEGQQLAEFTDALADVVGGDKYNPQALSDVSNELQNLGVEAADAKEALIAFAEAGTDPTRIEDYAIAAKDLADRLGVDLADATKLLTDIQNGGSEAVLNLTEKTHDLTSAELDHADALFDAGKAAEARQYILDRVADKNAQIAESTRSAWTPAVNNLRSAFSNLVSYLGNNLSPYFSTLQKEIEAAVVGLTYITALLAGKGFEGAKQDAFSVIRTQRGLNPKPAKGASAQDLRDRKYKKELDEEYTVTKDLTKAERLRRVEVQARRDAQAAGVSKSVEDLAVAKARTAEERKIGEEAAKAAKKSSSARNKAQREAEAAQRKIESTQRQLTSQLRSLDSATGKGASATLEERLAIVDNKYESIFDTLGKLKSLGISTSADGQSISAVEAQINASKERLKNEERIKFFEDQISLLTTQRKEEIETISDAQERGAKTTTEAYKAAEAANARISPQIVKAAQDALVVARSIAGTKPSPEMLSMIARLERIITGEGTTDVVNKVGTAALGTQEKELNALLSERNDLVAAYQTLNELGLKTDAETRDLTAAAYQAQSAAIKPVLEQLRETVTLLNQQTDALTGLPLLSDTAYNAWLAKIQAVEAGLVLTDARLTQVQTAARQAIEQGVTNAFNTAANAIVGLIDGTMSWGDALSSVFTTALQFAADFLKAIAQVLIQMVALQVAKSLIGGGFGGFLFHGGGVVGSGGSRVARSGGGGSWAGAPKFHGGGGMGLKPGEYKAVLERGEEVLTDDDPRHINNIGRGGGGDGGPSIKQNLFLDPEEIPKAMQTRSGERAILTIIRTNKETLKQVLK